MAQRISALAAARNPERAKAEVQSATPWSSRSPTLTPSRIVPFALACLAACGGSSGGGGNGPDPVAALRIELASTGIQPLPAPPTICDELFELGQALLFGRRDGPTASRMLPPFPRPETPPMPPIQLLAAAFAASVLLSFPARAQAAPAAPAAQANPATTPVARADEWWQARHLAMNVRVEQGKVELVFVGDSITQGWEGEGAALWAERYAPRHAVNLGISGDQTEHVLWRLEHGNLEGITPKAAVIMIGTNNVGNTNGAHSAEQIAAGVTAIVARIGKASPGTKILLLAIFPRGEKPNPMRATIAAINTRLAALADGKKIVYLDLGPKFLAADGSLPAELMPDFLHLSAKGYAVWADAIEADLAKMLGEK